MSKKLLSLFVILTLTLLMLVGCGQSTEENLAENNITSGRVIVYDAGESSVVYYGYHNYLCTALFEDGKVTEHVLEAQMTGDIYGLAISDGYLYMNASDGLFRYSLETLAGKGDASPEVLLKDSLSPFDAFQIFDGRLYYKYGIVLYSMPVEGGNKMELSQDAGDFAVTDEAVYYVTSTDKTLHRVNFDGSEDTLLEGVYCDSKLIKNGDALYFRDRTDAEGYSLAKSEIIEIDAEENLSEYGEVWSAGDSIIYQTDKYILKTRNLNNGSEKQFEINHNYPDKAYGTVMGKYVIGVSNSYSNMNVFDAENAEMTEYNLDDELKSYLDELGVSQSTDNTQNSGGGSAGFDILNGEFTSESTDGSQVFLYGNDFMLAMPNSDAWAYEKTASDCLNIYYVDARNAGFGGNLVTIKAYDMNDDSYLNLPSYAVAGIGRNVNKRFIAIFPSDVQYDPGDSIMADKYQLYYSHVKMIKEGDPDSPFRTSDGD